MFSFFNCQNYGRTTNLDEDDNTLEKIIKFLKTEFSLSKKSALFHDSKSGGQYNYHIYDLRPNCLAKIFSELKKDDISSVKSACPYFQHVMAESKSIIEIYEYYKNAHHVMYQLNTHSPIISYSSNEVYEEPKNSIPYYIDRFKIITQFQTGILKANFAKLKNVNFYTILFMMQIKSVKSIHIIQEPHKYGSQGKSSHRQTEFMISEANLNREKRLNEQWVNLNSQDKFLFHHDIDCSINDSLQSIFLKHPCTTNRLRWAELVFKENDLMCQFGLDLITNQKKSLRVLRLLGLRGDVAGDIQKLLNAIIDCELLDELIIINDDNDFELEKMILYQYASLGNLRHFTLHNFRIKKVPFSKDLVNKFLSGYLVSELKSVTLKNIDIDVRDGNIDSEIYNFTKIACNLEYIFLSECSITNKAIEYILHNCRSLKTLYLRRIDTITGNCIKPDLFSKRPKLHLTVEQCENFTKGYPHDNYEYREEDCGENGSFLKSKYQGNETLKSKYITEGQETFETVCNSVISYTNQ